MPTYNTLEAGGVEQTLAAWGITLESISGEFGSGITDTLRCSTPKVALDADAAFSFEQKIIFRLNRTSTTGAAGSFADGHTEFIGYRLDPAHDDLPNRRVIHYSFGNAWYFLSTALFEQKRASRPTETVDLAFPYTTDVALGMKLGTSNEFVELNNGQQITEILQFVLDYFAEQGFAQPFIIGTIDPDVPMPTFRTSEIWCATAILKCLEISPDCTVFFDYTTLLTGVPTPTIHVRRRGNLTPVTLALANGVDHASLRILPRPTLQLRSVVIQFKVTGQNEGRLWNAYATDKYGPNGANNAADPERGHRVLKQTFDLAGSSFVSAYLDTAAVNCNVAGNAAKRAWWGLFIKEFVEHTDDAGATSASTRVRFQDEDGVAVSIPIASVRAAQAWDDFAEGAAINLSDYPYFLRPNVSVQPWMTYQGATIRTVPAVIRTRVQHATYEVNDNTASPDGSIYPSDGTLKLHAHRRHVKSRELSVQVMLCNAPPGVYSTFSAGEGVPVGIAQKYFESLSEVQYSGENVRVEAAVTSLITLANTLNLSAGRAEWATMNAQVQMLRKEYGFGRTSVTFGPPTILTPDARLGIWRYNRSRVQNEDPRTRATGVLPGINQY